MTETGLAAVREPGPAVKKVIRQVADSLEKNCRQHNCLMVAVTGSIACGKSTVSGMLQDLGSPLIDFDRIAREVVAPGTPGYDRIVSCFGSRVVQPDGTLNRKALSDIVFSDVNKRKHLEQITHPLIFNAFLTQVEDLTAGSPDAIIQVAVPLLIELNIQHLFHKVIVVYLPRDIQLKRLADRDGISLEAAGAIIGSQLSADEKKPHADYVIDNSRDLEQTKKQVVQVWQQLQAVRKQRHRNTV
jgi:dephospho-CoA kinase